MEEVTEDELHCDVGEVLCVNLITGEWQKWDHYALRDRGMPDGWQVADQISTADWLNAIARAMG